MEIMFRLLVYMVVMFSAFSVFAYEYSPEQTQKLIEEMTLDLGGHDGARLNNGKVQRCVFGGTKKVSVVTDSELTTYNAVYSNCREKDKTRDGIYDVAIENGEVIVSSSRRSLNGELFDAAMKGNAAELKRLIKAKADVNYTESIRESGGGYVDEWTPLMSATATRSLDSVRHLVKAGAWVNYMNSKAVSALWIAAHNGDVEIVKYLLKSGAYADNRNYEDVTPLMAAAMNGHADVVKVLIAARAKLDYGYNGGDTALMFALERGHTDIARLLLAAGANVNVKNRSGLTALHIAAAEGNLEMVRLLLRRKADSGARMNDGRSALDIAKAKGHAAIVALLEKGR